MKIENTSLTVDERKMVLKKLKKIQRKFRCNSLFDPYAKDEKYKMLLNLQEKIILDEELSTDELKSLNNILNGKFYIYIRFFDILIRF